MREVKLKRTVVSLFDSVKSLSAERDHELKKLSLQDAKIGSTMDDVAKHYSTLVYLMQNDKKEDVIQELKNLHNNLYYQLNKIDIKSFCFAAMIESIDGNELTMSQLSDMDFVQKTLIDLSKKGLKQSDVNDIVEDIKKNLTQNFNPIFLINSEILEV